MTADRPDSPWVLPSHDDPVVASASQFIGGPVGRHAVVGRSWWTPVRVALVLVALASLLGVLADQPCRRTAWGDGTKQYTHACYSDVVHLYWGRGLSDGLVPYFSDTTGTSAEPVEYPVLTGFAMWVTSLPIPSTWTPTDRGRLYYDVNAAAALVLAMITVWATALVARRRVWDAVMVAVAPGLVLTATLNWDMWAVALTALGVLLWARRHPLAAGLLFGLAAATKFYPLLLLGPLLVLCFRAGRLRAFWLVLAGTAASWATVNVPVMLTSFDSWSRFYVMSRDRGADFGSLWLVLGGQGVDLSDVTRVNAWGAQLLAVLCFGIALLVLTAPRRPRFAQVAFLVLAAFLVTNKVYSPQYVLWLIPFAVLARPRWRDFLWWQAAEVLYFFAVWWYIHGFTDPDRALPQPSYYLAVLVHVAATTAFAGFVVRDIWWPHHDPVRASGDDDPSGGVLDGAPDRRARGGRAQGGHARGRHSDATGSDQVSSTAPASMPTLP